MTILKIFSKPRITYSFFLLKTELPRSCLLGSIILLLIYNMTQYHPWGSHCDDVLVYRDTILSSQSLYVRELQAMKTKLVHRAYCKHQLDIHLMICNIIFVLHHITHKWQRKVSEPVKLSWTKIHLVYFAELLFSTSSSTHSPNTFILFQFSRKSQTLCRLRAKDIISRNG